MQRAWVWYANTKFASSLYNSLFAKESGVKRSEHIKELENNLTVIENGLKNLSKGPFFLGEGVTIRC
jgi:hypothetical protein